MGGVVWRTLAISKMREYLQARLDEEEVILENFRKLFDLAVTAIVKPRASVSSEVVTNYLVKAIYYVKGSQRTIARCMEEAVKIKEKERRVWPFPLSFLWVVPSLSAARALYLTLKRFREAESFADVFSHIYVWNDVGPETRGELCVAEATAEEGSEPDTLVLLDLDDNELKRIPLYPQRFRQARRQAHTENMHNRRPFTRNCVR